jgi:hypothetical protein
MADPILLWNEVTLEADRANHTNGQVAQTETPRPHDALGLIPKPDALLRIHL